LKSIYIGILFIALISLSSCEFIRNYQIWDKLQNTNDQNQKEKIQEEVLYQGETELKAENIYLFNEGDSLDFEYIILGTVEGEAEKGSKEYLAESNLKYQAWSNYANAVIYLKEESIENVNANKNLKRLKGQAVKIKQDSAFFVKYGKINDLTFLDDLNKKEDIDPRKKYEDDLKSKKFLGVLSVILYIGLLVVLLLASANFGK
jgi:hypothetical protein